MNNETKQSKGGIARKNSLTKEQRSDIAKRAANSRWTKENKIPSPSYIGILKILDNEIPCAVIEIDGEVKRVIVQREVVGLITGNKKGGLDRYLKAINLQPFVPENIRVSTQCYFVERRGNHTHIQSFFVCAAAAFAECRIEIIQVVFLIIAVHHGKSKPWIGSK